MEQLKPPGTEDIPLLVEMDSKIIKILGVVLYYYLFAAYASNIGEESEAKLATQKLEDRIILAAQMSARIPPPPPNFNV